MSVVDLKSKAALRLKMQAARATISSERRELARNKLAETLFLQGLVLSYSSIKDEVETSSLNEKLLAEGRLVLPKVEGNNLLLFKIESLDQLEKSSLGILEPVAGQPVTLNDLSCALIPGLAFDSQGNRLGYGKGFYDRFIQPSLKTFGIAFKEQLVSEVPVSHFDRPVHSLLLF